MNLPKKKKKKNLHPSQQRFNQKPAEHSRNNNGAQYQTVLIISEQ